MDGKGERDKKDIYNELRQIMKHVENIFDILLPPKDVREEVIRNLKEAERSLWKAIKVYVDYKTEGERENSSGKAQKIKVE